MPPRFLERMQTQAAMQNQWHRDPHSGPPSYQYLDSQVPSQDPPTYRKALRAGPPPPAYREHQYSHLASIIDLHSFPDRSTLLVVGAYSRQGMHIIDRLLDHNYRVRGVVSNAREAAQTAKHFEARYGRGENYQSYIVPDMTKDCAFDVASKSCSGVVFVAGSASPLSGTNLETLAQVTHALDSSARQPNMHRFVYCSPESTSKTKPIESFIHPLIRAVSPNASAQQAAPLYDSGSDTIEDGREEWQMPVEVAIWDWVELCQPGFALDLVSLPSSFGAFSDSFVW